MKEKKKYETSDAIVNTTQKTTVANGGSDKNQQQVSQDIAKIANNVAQNKASSKIDMSSVLSLGYGPISEAKLAELVKKGEVIQYQENGVTKFRKNTKYIKSLSLR